MPYQRDWRATARVLSEARTSTLEGCSGGGKRHALVSNEDSEELVEASWQAGEVYEARIRRFVERWKPQRSHCPVLPFSGHF